MSAFLDIERSDRQFRDMIDLRFSQGVANDSVRLRYCAASLTNRSPIFRRITLPLFLKV